MTASTRRFHAEIETPSPLQVPADRAALTGWCFAAGELSPPSVRLSTPVGILPLATRCDRDDVARRFPDQAAARACGFTLAGQLPAGLHVARLEARLPDGDWHVCKILTLAVTEAPLACKVEFPATATPITTRTFVEGWALHPAQPITALTLRYGHQEIPAHLGRSRPDLPARFPHSPRAAAAGFRSATILSAGQGPLRLRARLADGATSVVRTPLQVSILTDENHGPELNWNHPRIPLPGYAQRPPPTAIPAQVPQNILFILYGNLTANSSLQVSAFANALADAGHRCALALPDDVETLRHQIAPRYRVMLHAEAIRTGGGFANGRGPDIVHAWTTRESVRGVALAVRARHGGRLVVQLEDNEQEILAQRLGRPWPELAALPPGEIDALVPPDLAHPRHSRAFLEAADGVTLITGRLREHVPAGKPCVTIHPAADERYFFPRPPALEFRQALGLADEATVLCYPGNLHAANAAEIQALYLAVAELNEAGIPVVLIRAGTDSIPLPGDLATRTRPYVIALGQILNHRHLPPLLALADILVQPGVPDAFNDYRFPSKLPEFFAIGRPVILPRTNLGELTRHGTDAYVLERADAAGIGRAIRELRADAALRKRLAEGAAAFAARHFSWPRSAAALANFYLTLAPS